MAKETLPAYEKIQVLLAEYSSLRSHVVSRSASSIEVVAIGVAAMAFVASQLHDHLVTGLAIMGALALVIGIIGRFLYRDLIEEAAHVCELERRINALAGGEKLLTWETEKGRVMNGYWRGFLSVRRKG